MKVILKIKSTFSLNYEGSWRILSKSTWQWLRQYFALLVSVE